MNAKRMRRQFLVVRRHVVGKEAVSDLAESAGGAADPDSSVDQASAGPGGEALRQDAGEGGEQLRLVHGERRLYARRENRYTFRLRVHELLKKTMITPRDRQTRWIEFAITIGAMCCLIVALHLMGRAGWCEHGVGLWTWEPAGPCTSQHFGDPYSLTHVEHGFLFYWLTAFSRRWTNPTKRYAASIALEVCWELIENTSWVIDRYRAQTAALGYSGDSILNSCGDLLACCLGYAVASWLPAKWTVALAIASELALLLVIRDNLTLNVLMLLVSVPAIERWQLGR